MSNPRAPLTQKAIYVLYTVGLATEFFFLEVLSQALFVFDEIDQSLSVSGTINALIVASFVLIIKLVNTIQQRGNLHAG